MGTTEGKGDKTKGKMVSFPAASHTDTLLNLTIQVKSSWPNLYHHLGCTKQLVTFYTNRNISFYLPVPARLLRSQSPYIHLSLFPVYLSFSSHQTVSPWGQGQSLGPHTVMMPRTQSALHKHLCYIRDLLCWKSQTSHLGWQKRKRCHLIRL